MRPAPTVSRIGLPGRLAFLLLLIATSLLLAASGLLPSPLPGSDSAEARSRLVAPAKVCPDRSARGGAAQIKRARKSMMCLVNYARKRKGLRKYRKHSKLAWSAKRKAADILRCNSFSHNACGRKFDFWIKRSGYASRRGWTTGENIAWGSGNLGNVRSIFRAWMNSPGHRSAILDGEFTDAHAGVVSGRMKGIPGARAWVLHFGHRY